MCRWFNVPWYWGKLADVVGDRVEDIRLGKEGAIDVLFGVLVVGTRGGGGEAHCNWQMVDC